MGIPSEKADLQGVPAEPSTAEVAEAYADFSAVVPSQWLLDKYCELDKAKFVEAIAAAGLAGCFKLAFELVKGQLTGPQLLAALRFLDDKFGLPKLTATEIAANKRLAVWRRSMKANGFDPEVLLATLSEPKP